MLENDEITRKIHNIDNLKQYVLNNYFEDLRLEEEIGLYDDLIKHFFSSDLDDIYDNSLFDNMDKSSRKNVLEEAHKYQDLCFYDGNVNYWVDSCDSIPVEDYDLITYQLMDNFEFLIKLYLTGGKKSLDLLRDYNESIYRDKNLSCVEDIRRNFVTDEVLFNVFDNMSNDNTMYDVFTKNEKNTLLEYPEGTLYFYGDESIKITNPLFLSLEIYYRMNGKTYDISGRDDFLKVSSSFTGFFLNEDNFDNTIMDMFYEYQEKFGTIDAPTIVSDKVDSVINRNILRDKWIMQDEALLLDIDAPVYKTK